MHQFKGRLTLYFTSSSSFIAVFESQPLVTLAKI